MAAKHEQAAGPERVSGTGRDEHPLEWPPVGDFRRRSHVIVLRICEALLVGTLQCPRIVQKTFWTVSPGGRRPGSPAMAKVFADRAHEGIDLSSSRQRRFVLDPCTATR